jgi:tetratricopeptide (TPR) repeat protein
MSERILDLVALTARAIQVGNTAISNDLLHQLLEAAPESPTALSLSAAWDLSQGDIDAAIRGIEAALRLAPRNLNANVEAARIYFKAGQPKRAVIHSQRVLDALPGFPGLRELYFKWAFADSNYRDFLPLLHECLAPSVYLETGVEKGRSFKHARGAEIAIGIDPEMGLVPSEYRDWGRLFEMTSDDFFAKGHYEETCGERRIDLAFIDGMHLFEYTLRDFINIERRAHARSVVFIHDIIPINTVSAARLRKTGQWMGDVWKVMLVLKRYRPDLDLAVINAGPSGLAVVRGLDPSSRVLLEHYAQIVANFTDIPLDHGFLDQLKVKRIPAESQAIRELFAS